MGWDGSVTRCAVVALTGRGRGGERAAHSDPLAPILHLTSATHPSQCGGPKKYVRYCREISYHPSQILACTVQGPRKIRKIHKIENRILQEFISPYLMFSFSHSPKFFGPSIIIGSSTYKRVCRSQFFPMSWGDSK